MPVEMKITDLARLLKTAPDTIERWIRQGRIPVRKKGDLCEFSRAALKKWAEAHHMPYNLKAAEAAPLPEAAEDSLMAAMRRGGILYDVAGDTVREVLDGAVSRMDFIEGIDGKNRVLKTLMEREEMMSTGIGKGVAVPHPRAPLADMDLPALITTCFLRAPVDFRALDGRPVFVLFVLMAPSAKRHLHLLARLSFCLRHDDFISFLRRVPEKEAFYAFVSTFEQGALSGK